ncbi:hypothetical protein M8J75_001334 [Diaphorina citri]|nr:hypothetical protein M8J75_001334 [Diaphorina citri]
MPVRSASALFSYSSLKTATIGSRQTPLKEPNQHIEKPFSRPAEFIPQSTPADIATYGRGARGELNVPRASPRLGTLPSTYCAPDLTYACVLGIEYHARPPAIRPIPPLFNAYDGLKSSPTPRPSALAGQFCFQSCFSIEHCPGRENELADVLSRYPDSPDMEHPRTTVLSPRTNHREPSYRRQTVLDFGASANVFAP